MIVDEDMMTNVPGVFAIGDAWMFLAAPTVNSLTPFDLLCRGPLQPLKVLIWNNKHVIVFQTREIMETYRRR